MYEAVEAVRRGKVCEDCGGRLATRNPGVNRLLCDACYAIYLDREIADQRQQFAALKGRPRP